MLHLSQYLLQLLQVLLSINIFFFCFLFTMATLFFCLFCWTRIKKSSKCVCFGFCSYMYFIVALAFNHWKLWMYESTSNLLLLWLFIIISETKNFVSPNFSMSLILVQCSGNCRLRIHLLSFLKACVWCFD